MRYFIYKGNILNYFKHSVSQLQAAKDMCEILLRESTDNHMALSILQHIEIVIKYLNTMEERYEMIDKVKTRSL